MSDKAVHHTGRIVLYFLAGAAAGAAIALLTAPRTGRETRRKLRQITGDLADRAARVAPAVSEAYRRATAAGKEAFVSALGTPTAPIAKSASSQH
jgi:gas vesicle protein